jgi:hypothetical protein
LARAKEMAAATCSASAHWAITAGR